MDKQNVVYAYSAILFGHKKKQILIHAIIWMNLENVMLANKARNKR